MEMLFELLFQFFGEFLLQIAFEFIVELGFHSVADTFQKRRHPILSGIGFTLWGLMAGGASLLIFPSSAISDPRLRMANLLITPTFVGLCMGAIGKLREKRGQSLVNLDRFRFAFIFALSMASVRFYWATT